MTSRANSQSDMNRRLSDQGVQQLPCRCSVISAEERRHGRDPYWMAATSILSDSSLQQDSEAMVPMPMLLLAVSCKL